MLKDGKFYSRTELIKIVNEAADIVEANFEVIEVMNNYAVLPYKLRAFEKYLPGFVRKKIGHNVGMIIKK